MYGRLGRILHFGSIANGHARLIRVGPRRRSGHRSRFGLGLKLAFGFEPNRVVLAGGATALLPQLRGAAGDLLVRYLLARLRRRHVLRLYWLGGVHGLEWYRVDGRSSRRAAFTPTAFSVADPIAERLNLWFLHSVVPLLDTDVSLPRVLIVDDDDTDRLLAWRALQRIGVRNPIEVFGSGSDFMSFIESAVEEVGHHGRISACLVFVDLRMPPPDGFEILQWIRQRPELSHVQVVVLTGSVDPKDMRRAAELRADLYLPKFPSNETLARVVSKATAAALQALRVADAGMSRRRELGPV